MAANLQYRCRTRAYRSDYAGNTVAHWYVRIHHQQHMANPLDGVVKVSRLACDLHEKENGLPQDLVDHISQYLIRERSVSPYGADRRWASHLYPIYLTEEYLKSRFLSDLAFNGVF